MKADAEKSRAVL